MIGRILGRKPSGGTKAAFAAVVAALALAAPAEASPGQLDPSFGDGGVAEAPFPVSSSATDAIELPDGKVIVVGSSGLNDFAVARYNPDGSLDASFGDGGRLVAPIGTLISTATAVALAPDGKILVEAVGGGDIFAGDPAAVKLLRYNHDGSLDTTFGEDGSVNLGRFPGDMAVQRDGRIVLSFFEPPNEVTVCRLAANAAPDSSFGSGGCAQKAFDGDGGFGALALAPDGKVVVAGETDRDTAAAMRFEPDGSVDRSFGTDGLATASLEGNAHMNAVAVAPDGGVVLAGSSGLRNSVETFVRFGTTGSLDNSFGSGGVVTNGNPVNPPQTEAADVAVGPDGKILAAGDLSDRVNAQSAGDSFLVTRLDPDGSLDRAFGNGGNVVTNVNGAATHQDDAAALVLRANGTFVVAGRSASLEPCGTGCLPGAEHDFALAAYRPDGSLDGAFGTGGTVVTTFSPPRAEPQALTVDDRGEIDVAGAVSGFGIETPALARIEWDGRVDVAWQDQGHAIPSFKTSNPANVEAATVQANGGVAVGGSEAGGQAAHRVLVVGRYTPAGTPDTSFAHGAAATAEFADAARTSSILTRSDGSVLVDGPMRKASGVAGAVARFDPNGSLDPAFGRGGKLVLPPRYVGRPARHGVVSEPKGRVVLVGSGGGFRLTELNRGGSIARSFGDHGRVRTRFRGKSRAEGALRVHGGVAVYGRTGGRMVLARYRRDGTLDRAFGEKGIARAHVRAFSDVVATVQPNGKIILAGARNGHFALARFAPDGALDKSFGDSGVLASPVQGVATSVTWAGRGKILVAGSGTKDGVGEFVVARFDGGTAAQQHRAEAAKRRHRHRAPNPVPAWYINATNPNDLKRFAAADACAFARAQPKSAQRTLILDFGGARAYPDGSFGAAVNNSSFAATNQQIQGALKAAADAYAACHRQGRATIAYANTNHFSIKFNAARARQIGVHQALAVSTFGGYVHGAGYAPVVRAGIAGDIEPGYWGPQYSKAMVNGAKSVRRHDYMDFGTAGGCPPYLKHQPHPRYHKCLNNWTLDDVAHVSNSGGGEPLPEIYYRGGRRHFDQAAQWGFVARRWNSRHATPYTFFGATGSTEFSGLTPGASWTRLKHKTPGHVGRELLNFKQDHWQPVPTRSREARR